MGKYNFELDLKDKSSMSIIAKTISNNSRVLEFGCANGRLTKYLKEEKECSVVIVEIDEEPGENSKRYSDNAYIGKDRGDIENYFWDTEGEFDYIIFADVLEHLRDPKKVLTRCRSHLCEEGRVLITIPNIAHNSVIIDLLKNNFEYKPLGILDDTHIKFFTDVTLKKIINESGLHVLRQDYILSRVGHNEIQNSYLDIPVEVSDFLRKQQFGSVYQYFYELGLNDVNNIVTDLSDLDIDKYEELESCCYVKEKNDIEFSESKKVSKIINVNFKSVEFELDGYQDIAEIRWDPICFNCIIKINCIFAIKLDGNNVNIDLDLLKCNALQIEDEILVFDTEDPQIVLPRNNVENIKRLVIGFEIINYRYDIENNKIFRLVIALLRKKEQQKKNIEILEEKFRAKIFEVEVKNQELEMKNQELEMKNQELEIKNQELEIKNQELEIKNQELEIKNQEIEGKLKAELEAIYLYKKLLGKSICEFLGEQSVKEEITMGNIVQKMSLINQNNITIENELKKINEKPLKYFMYKILGK